MDNFKRVLDILQGNTLTEAKNYDKMESMGKVYTGKFPASVKSKLDPDVAKTATGVCVCENGDIWSTTDKDPKDPKSKWSKCKKCCDK